MRKAHFVVAALALAVSASAPAQAEAVHRRHVRTHAKRAVPPVASAGAGLVAPENPEVGSAINQTSSSIARTDAATRAITRDAFAPLLRMIYPPGNSGDL